jgi:ribonuclease HI
MVTVFTDGGARGNPGPAGIGVVITDDGQTLEEFGAYVGEMTNNQAEYTALLAGLERAQKHTDTDVRCVLDSELVVKQLSGEYKVKSEQLAKLFHQVRAQEKNFKRVTYEHTLREGNERADALVNEALDRKAAED